MEKMHLNPMPQMGQVPQHPMPMGQVPQHPMPAGQVPQHHMSMGQGPHYPMPQAAQPLMPQAVPVSQVVPVPQVALGPEPCSVTCPSCGSSVITTVVAQPTTQTHLMALLLCCLCIFCTCIPYCMDSCQNADHLCPNCGAYLGTYKR